MGLSQGRALVEVEGGPLGRGKRERAQSSQEFSERRSLDPAGPNARGPSSLRLPASLPVLPGLPRCEGQGQWLVR